MKYYFDARKIFMIGYSANVELSIHEKAGDLRGAGSICVW